MAKLIARPDNIGFSECSIFNPTFIGSEKNHLVIGHFNLFSFSSAFHWSPSVSKPRMTPVSFVKTTGQPRMRLRNHTMVADKSYEICRLGHHLGCTFTENLPQRAGLIAASECAAIAGCKISFFIIDFWRWLCGAGCSE